MIELIIFVIYASFVVDFLIWPVVSEASTVSMLKNQNTRFTVEMIAIFFCQLMILLLWIYPLLVPFFGENFSAGQVSMWIQWAGLGIAIVGRLISIAASYQLRRRKSTEMLTTGIFRYSRHPIVIGLHLTLAGLLLAVVSKWFWIPYILSLFYFDYKVRIEETINLEKFGTAYSKYCNTTPRYLI